MDDLQWHNRVNPPDAARPETNLTEDDFDNTLEDDDMENKPAAKGIDLQMFILGHMLYNPIAAAEIVFSLSEEDFDIPIHAKIFATIRDLEDKGESIDAPTIAAKLPFENIHAVLQDLIKTTHSINAYYDYDIKMYETPEEEALNLRKEKNYKSAFDMLEPMMAYLKNGRQTIASGLEEFDFKTGGGFHKGNLVVVGSRPSQGKTAFAVNLALNAVLADKTVLFFTLQNNGRNIFNRMVCAESKISMHKLRSGNLSEDNKKKLEKSARDIGARALFIEDTPNLTVGEICSKSRAFVKERKEADSEKGLDILIIDGIREINPETILRLKALARALNAAVFITANLPSERIVWARDFCKRSRHYQPQLSELAQTGIQEYADLVCFLHRDYYYKRDDESLKNRAELILAKNRDGSTGYVSLHFDSETGRFRTPDLEDIKEI